MAEAHADRTASLLRLLDDLARNTSQDSAEALKQLLDATRSALGASRAEVRPPESRDESAGDELRTPLRHGSLTLGVLAIAPPHPAHVWSDTDRLFVAAVAERASLLLAESGLRDREAHIAAREQMEDALRASEESYRTIFQHAADAMWLHDLETGDFLEVNEAACEMYGYTVEETKALGVQGLSDGRPPFDFESAYAYMQRALAGEPQRFEWLGRHKDGSEVWGEVTLRRVNILGVDRLLATARDINDRKRAEQALLRSHEELENRVEQRTAELVRAKAEAERAREEAERANSAKSEFLSRMSHELRTPMNSILGFAQVLARGELRPEQERSVQHIVRAGKHLLRLINEVLEIARIEAGSHSLSIEPVPLGAVLHEAMSLVKPVAAQSEIELEGEPWDHGDAFVRADRQRLVQILLNLLSNGIKYNRPGGRVRVTCGRTSNDGEAPLWIRIEDTGRGIRAEYVDQLFTPFARLGAEQSDVEGTGLGLALSQRMAEAMSGSLTLERTGPGGSAFRLELAAARPPIDALRDVTPHAEQVVHTYEPATLLYIEDNLANLSLVETFLAFRPGWRVIPALQGGIGLELARESRPDLVLLDLHLPDINGEEVLKRLRADERTASIPVIIISADATRATLDRLRKAGADAYLTKPLDMDEFLDTVERYLTLAGEGERTR
jgi:PAS domain S-box-containing protein